MPIPPEALAAAVLGAISIIGVVFQMSFGWSCLFVGLFLIVTVDLCLCSAISRSYFDHPLTRVVLSTVAMIFITLVFWTPLRTQYMKEHLPPSFAYFAVGWAGASHYGTEGMTLLVFWRHYGPNPAYNVDADFVDVDRRLITNRHYSDALYAQDHREFHKSEIDESLAGITYADQFVWVPLYPDHQHFQVNIK